jgi:MtN3 and saliva related transmembrane protein
LSTGEILGLVAGFLTTFSIVPQIIKVFKNRSSRDISLIFTMMFVAGGVLWLAYGLVDGLLPVIVWNALGVTFNLILLLAKVWYMRLEKQTG